MIIRHAWRACTNGHDPVKWNGDEPCWVCDHEGTPASAPTVGELAPTLTTRHWATLRGTT